ncbi:hypothetical protein [Paracoccus sp. T5]|uniref:hypothetical protein n=1 Tax=Paracoccus sp. T5 TaxID=3402161 RepID=UPI003AE670C9
MSQRQDLALVPARIRLPARTGSGRASGTTEPLERNARQTDYRLSSGPVIFQDRKDVERLLPDILGRALALAWIDSEFRQAFTADPLKTLADNRIVLPATIRIEVVQEGQARPMVIVSDIGTAHTPARRLLYLQLVMVAGR